eukprot:scaffold819_cov239-Pinguiococcus_pyrenoidosus.AAC.4
MRTHLVFACCALVAGGAGALSALKSSVVDFQVQEHGGLQFLEDVVKRYDVEPVAGEMTEETPDEWPLAASPASSLEASPIPFLQLGPDARLRGVQDDAALLDLQDWTLFFAGQASSTLDVDRHYGMLLGPGSAGCERCFVRYEPGNRLGIYLPGAMLREELPYTVTEPHTLMITKDNDVISAFQNGELVGRVGLRSSALARVPDRHQAWADAEGKLHRVLVNRVAASNRVLDVPDAPPPDAALPPRRRRRRRRRRPPAVEISIPVAPAPEEPIPEEPLTDPPVPDPTPAPVAAPDPEPVDPEPVDPEPVDPEPVDPEPAPVLPPHRRRRRRRRTRAPTKMPTPEPTSQPPTMYPTKHPTEEPTPEPTKAPTEKPTHKPTVYGWDQMTYALGPYVRPADAVVPGDNLGPACSDTFGDGWLPALPRNAEDNEKAMRTCGLNTWLGLTDRDEKGLWRDVISHELIFVESDKTNNQVARAKGFQNFTSASVHAKIEDADQYADIAGHVDAARVLRAPGPARAGRGRVREPDIPGRVRSDRAGIRSCRWEPECPRRSPPGLLEQRGAHQRLRLVLHRAGVAGVRALRPLRASRAAAQRRHVPHHPVLADEQLRQLHHRNRQRLRRRDQADDAVVREVLRAPVAHTLPHCGRRPDGQELGSAARGASVHDAGRVHFLPPDVRRLHDPAWPAAQDRDLCRHGAAGSRAQRGVSRGDDPYLGDPNDRLRLRSAPDGGVPAVRRKRCRLHRHPDPDHGGRNPATRHWAGPFVPGNSHFRVSLHYAPAQSRGAAAAWLGGLQGEVEKRQRDASAWPIL